MSPAELQGVYIVREAIVAFAQMKASKERNFAGRPASK